MPTPLWRASLLKTTIGEFYEDSWVTNRHKGSINSSAENAHEEGGNNA